MIFFWLAFLISYLFHFAIRLINYRYWNHKENREKYGEVMSFSDSNWKDMSLYNKDLYFYKEFFFLLSFMIISLLLFTGGFSLLQKGAYSLSGGGESMFWQAFWFFFIWISYDYIFGKIEKKIIQRRVQSKHHNLAKESFIPDINALISYALSVFMTSLVAVSITAIIFYFESLWPLMIFLMMVFFCLLTVWVIPSIINKFFNKKYFKKIEDYSEEWSQKINTFFEKNGIEKRALWVDVGTEKKEKIGAHVDGLFHGKRMVINEGAFKKLEDKEIFCILAHEVGHERFLHKLWYLTLIVVSATVTMSVMLPLLQNDGVAQALGFSENNPHIAVFALWLLSSLVQEMLFFPLNNYIKRRAEYQADAFATKVCGGTSKISVLKKTFQKNLSLPILHPLYSLWYRDHPTLPERIKNVEKVASSKE